MVRTARERIDGDLISRDIYQTLTTALDAVGSYSVEEKKTSFHIVHQRAFLGVHPRQRGLLINIVLDRALDSPRTHRVEHVSAMRWHNEVLLTSVEEIDSEFLEWIKAANDLTL